MARRAAMRRARASDGTAVSGSKRRPVSSSGRKAQTRNDRRRAHVAQRRAAASATVRAQRRVRRRRTAGIVGAGIVLLGVGLTGVLIVRGGGSGPEDVRLRSELVDDAPGDLAVTTVPSAYRVVYRVDSYDETGHVSTDTEEFQVRRPFDAAIEGKAGAPPGTSQQWKSISNLGLYSDTSSGSDPEVSHVLPQTALADLRLDAVLGDLVQDGSFTPREQRKVLGRTCQVYRTGAPLETFSVAKATATDYADACIDESGLLLEEVTAVSGKLGGRMVATSVDDQATPANTTFAITGTPAALADGGAELASLDLAQAPVPGYWVLDPPTGYQHTGRYRLRQQSAPPANGSDVPATTEAPAPTILESYVDVYAKGTTVLVVQQGAKAAEQAPDASDPTKQTATLGTLGTVETHIGLTGTTLIAHPANKADWFVHVTASTPLAQLEQLATPLHASSSARAAFAARDALAGRLEAEHRRRHGRVQALGPAGVGDGHPLVDRRVVRRGPCASLPIATARRPVQVGLGVVPAPIRADGPSTRRPNARSSPSSTWSTTGTRNRAPAEARTTFGLVTSTVSGASTTASAPAASAVRSTVPRLPGSLRPAAATTKRAPLQHHAIGGAVAHDGEAAAGGVCVVATRSSTPGSELERRRLRERTRRAAARRRASRRASISWPAVQRRPAASTSPLDDERTLFPTRTAAPQEAPQSLDLRVASRPVRSGRLSLLGPVSRRRQSSWADTTSWLNTLGIGDGQVGQHLAVDLDARTRAGRR